MQKSGKNPIFKTSEVGSCSIISKSIQHWSDLEGHVWACAKLKHDFLISNTGKPGRLRLNPIFLGLALKMEKKFLLVVLTKVEFGQEKMVILKN